MEGHSEQSKLVWLARLRWAAIGLFFFLAIPGYIYGALNRETLVIYVGLLAVLFIFNLVTHLFFIESRKDVGPLFICLQLTLDLVILSSLLLASGGFRNPFVALFLVNAGLGGVLIRGRFSWPFIILCHALLSVLQIQLFIDNEGLSQIAWAYVFASHILLLSVFLVMRSLGFYLENHFAHQAQAKIQYEKQDRLRALGALAAGFSHEFASPLNAAKLRIDRLERNLNTLNENAEWYRAARENLAEAKISIGICESVIRSMNGSQLDVRDQNLKSVSMSEFIPDVTDSWLEEHPGAQLRIENNMNSRLLISPINLAQVLLNLLDNAFEANPSAPIRLQLGSDKDWVVLSVDDQGPGFSERVLSRRGEPFVTTKEGGTGLGLYVSEIFVQSLGGHLVITNKEDQSGATVTLSWPLAKEAQL